MSKRIGIIGLMCCLPLFSMAAKGGVVEITVEKERWHSFQTEYIFFETDSLPATYSGITAHRGNSSVFPGNTMPAFRSAIGLGVDWVELDIHKTKDGKIVVSHDKQTGRTGNADLIIADQEYEVLRQVDVATEFRKREGLTLKECPPQELPLLEEVLRLFKKQDKVKVSIQPKADVVADAIEIIERLEMEDRVGFNDGSLKYMSQVKDLNSRIPVFWDRPANFDLETDLPIALEKGFETMVINEKGLTQAKVDKIKKAGLEVGVWTVDKEEDLKKFVDMGVDRIYTDYPSRLIRIKYVNVKK